MASDTPFLTARWEDLVMLNYQVPAGLLSPLVPEGTQLDSFEGRTLMSMVGFRFLDTRVKGVAVPWHRDFDEVNLRLYVRREHEDGLRRGVVFIKEIVPRRAIAWLANALYNEKYVAMPMGHSRGPSDYAYRFHQPGRGDASLLTLKTDGASILPAPESEACFITEHYYGYVSQRDGSTMEYRVQHPPWRVWPGHAPQLQCDASALYGEELAPYLAAEPTSCFVAEGSDVAVYPGRRL